MTPVPRHEPEERERRIRAAAEAISYCMPATFDDPEQRRSRVAAEAALDAADEVVPMVPEAEYLANDQRWHDDYKAMQTRWERAEATARDLYGALDDFLGGKHEHDGAYQRLHDVLARHPAFAPPPEGEDG